MKEQQSQIQSKVEEILKEQGLDLVEFKVFYSGSKTVVRCLIDYPQGGITIDECARINKKIFSYLEEHKLLGEDFTVEVNSPGITRPLKTYKDFMRVKGKVVSFWLNQPIEDKSYLEMKVLDVSDKGVYVEKNGKGVEITFEQIKLGKERI
ncbi:MAG: hypothetical protein JSW17_05965 [Candidatus Omnitrophota bacterium]|nr:MAG: hypothetical protein JSW17_05965 [Candidatus Omnitrophota bacterium]